MSDYIKRESAIRALKKQRSDWNCDFNVPIDNCIEALKKVKPVELPTKCIAEVTIDREDVIRYLKKNDYVRVVQCKDCIHCADDYINTGMGYMPAFTCELGGINDNDSVDPTDYCSYGERKDGDINE